jgi:hypothetical protein
MQALILGALVCLSALPLLLGDAGGNESAQVGEVKRLQAEADVAFLQMLQKMDNQEMVDSHDMALLDELMAELGQEAGLGPSPRKLVVELLPAEDLEGSKAAEAEQRAAMDRFDRVVNSSRFLAAHNVEIVGLDENANPFPLTPALKTHAVEEEEDFDELVFLRELRTEIGDKQGMDLELLGELETEMVEEAFLAELPGASELEGGKHDADLLMELESELRAEKSAAVEAGKLTLEEIEELETLDAPPAKRVFVVEVFLGRELPQSLQTTALLFGPAVALAALATALFCFGPGPPRAPELESRGDSTRSSCCGWGLQWPPSPAVARRTLQRMQSWDGEVSPRVLGGPTVEMERTMRATQGPSMRLQGPRRSRSIDGA